MIRDRINLAMLLISRLSKQKSINSKALARPHKGHQDDQGRLTQLKSRFSDKLADLLSRPIPKSHQCRLCGHFNSLASATPLVAMCIFSGHDLVRFTCCNCGGIFGPVQLICCKPRELARLYKSLYRFYSEGFSTPYQEKTFYLLNPSPTGEYINYACGDWTHGIRRLQELNWQVTGYEPFQKVDAPSIYTSESLDPAKMYDGLMSHNYIEHVQDPATFFEKCFSMIKPGGSMAHSSACFEYLYEVSPFHLFFYCGNSVSKLADRTGFRVMSRYSSDMELAGHQYICYTFERMTS